jgi:hypothetical protein
MDNRKVYNQQLTIWKLENWRETLIWGPQNDATIDNNNVLFH